MQSLDEVFCFGVVAKVLLKSCALVLLQSLGLGLGSGLMQSLDEVLCVCVVAKSGFGSCAGLVKSLDEFLSFGVDCCMET